MKRVVITFLALAVLFAGCALIAPGFVDWNKHKPEIIAQLHEATGHDYAIGGDIALSLLPFPRVSVGGLSVAAPGTAGGGKILEIEKASVQLALIPLFKGRIAVSKVLLQKPLLTLSIAGDGAQSWMTPVLQQKMKIAPDSRSNGVAAGLANAIKLDEISVKGGAFSFSDARSGRREDFSSIDAVLRGESLFGPYNLSGSFVRNKHQIGVKLDTGRIDKLAEAVSVRLETNFPDIGSSASYAGVFSLKDGVFEAQGEAGINTPDLAGFTALFSGAPAPAPAALNRALSAKGVVTIGRDQVAWRNLQATFAGIEGRGAIVLKNTGKSAKAPLDAAVSFETVKSFALEKLFPPAAKAKKENGGPAFLPETFILPRDMTAQIAVKAPSFSYGGAAWREMALDAAVKQKQFAVQMRVKGENGTDIAVDGALDFAARTVSSKSGAVTYSDPVLALKAEIRSAEPLALAALLGKKNLNPRAANLLASTLEAKTDWFIEPHAVALKNSSVRLGDTLFMVEGGFTPGGEGARDAARLAVGVTAIDADYWLAKMAGPGNAAVPVPAAKPDIAAIARSIALPFDLEMSAQAEGIRFKGRDYTQFALKGKLTEGRLALETLRLTSNEGDSFLLAGTVADLKAPGGIDLSFKADVADLEQTLETLKIKVARLPADVGRAELLAEVRGNPSDLAFTANLKALRGSMEASGKIADALGAPKFSDLTLRLRHPNYVDLARLYKPDFNSGVAIRKDLDIFASMNRKENVYTFSQLQAVVGPSRIEGDVVADLSGAKPAVTAALAFTDLPLDDLLGVRRGSGKAQQTQDTRWSRNAINTAAFHKADVALKATADSLTYGNWKIGNAGINLDLKDGVLNIKQMDGGLYGGHAAVTGTLKTSPNEREPLSFAGDILAQDVSLEDFVSSFSGARLVKARGNVSVQSSIQTTGISPAALVFDLKGKGTAQGADIVFEGFDLARLSQALAEPSSSFTQNFSRLLDATMKGGSTQFDKLDGVFTITEGVINFDKMDLTGPSADVVTRGTVSLPLWSMDLESTVQLKEPPDAPPLRASFKGPLDRPAQTFGQSAMQQYFQKQIEGLVLNPLLEEVDKSGTLKNIMGLGGGGKTAVPQQPAVPAPSVPQSEVPPPAQPEPQPEPEPESRKEMTPEDAIFGIIKNVIEAQ